MPPINFSQQKVIANFIQVSRKEFGLSRRRSGFKASLRRTSCSLLLIGASAVGGFSAPTYADEAQEKASVIERMP